MSHADTLRGMAGLSYSAVDALLAAADHAEGVGTDGQDD